MFKTFTIFFKFFKSLILLILWTRQFCDFMSYLGFWLYFGCIDFLHNRKTTSAKAGKKPMQK